ncbi:o-succinylbenzoate synthase [Erwinia psidii]|uniref:o-succinylbenzoate synthase n=1 Tax=Erwinia psidii TaxID=69224 RepID=A0A3N6SM30_9GAMM|nr:o-succinylbenzoate synthase [Erwinia psidii]MCX8956588.1 o-succinylbenzoate synthase [Erwinia psidii]MCX8961502.1 o-succinylbenzoate synthase [Erwinia psidii]MCX8965030.1 o-succinylbenzoate synthase [Erwinia psidii]RQM39921.1 o-succinylbenzoate synthase [Erwinia psidii]
MRGATLFSYRIPLAAGTVLRDRRVKERCGLLVQLTEAGRQGWGEIAPLPGFSRETLDEARSEAAGWLQRWCSGTAIAAESPLPSVAFGLSCALAELHDVLPQAARYRSATLCTGDPDDLVDQLNRQHHPLAKMKVGLYEPVRDAMMVNLLLEAIPTLTLRLDANRQWTPEKARKFAGFLVEALKPRIAFVEEPCRSPEESRQFAWESGLALAWDESVREDGYQPVAEPHLAALVIKPSLTGSLEAVRALTAQAEQAGIAVIISSSLESSLGLTQLARLAAWLTPATLPGLDTLDLMSHQLVRGWPGCLQPLRGAGELETVWQC